MKEIERWREINNCIRTDKFLDNLFKFLTSTSERSINELREDICGMGIDTKALVEKVKLLVDYRIGEIEKHVPGDRFLEAGHSKDCEKVHSGICTCGKEIRNEIRQ